MSPVSVRIDGIDKLRRRLAELDKNVRSELMTEALLAAAEPVRAQAEASAPRRRGVLAVNVVKEVDEKEEKGTVKVGPRTRDAFYGYFIELGTSKMAAKPFLRPAIESQRKAAVEEARKVLARGLMK